MRGYPQNILRFNIRIAIGARHYPSP